MASNEKGKGELDPGQLSAVGLRLGIVASRWNAAITDSLVDGALRCAAACGAEDGQIRVIRVPGAWEIPFAVQALAQEKRSDAIIAIGCLIRGETPHFEYISGEVTTSLGVISRYHAVPIAYGLLTVESFDQAVARSLPDRTNKGWEAMEAAIEMAHTLAEIRRGT